MFRVSRSSVSNVFLIVGLCMGLFAATWSNPVFAAPTTARQVVIEAREYAFVAPASIGAGYTSFTLVNRGHDPHHAQIARLQNGKTMADLMAALRGSNPNAAFALLEFVGGPAFSLPGQRSSSVTLNLRTGNYVLMCFISDEDGTPHFAKGMIKPMRVVAGGSASKPTADGTVLLRDFSFRFSANMRPGTHTWNIVNQGPQPHEMVLFKLNPGKTLADVMAEGNGPPPFRSLGGMQALNPGKSGWVTVNLQPGTYVAICEVPDSRTGKSHAELGMVYQFTVAGAAAGSPATLPNTGGETQAPLLLVAAALGFFALGMTLRRRRSS
jgi:LPXTG-motif cell wall-anchored protein